MKIEIEIEDVSGKMFLRQGLGTATLPDGTEIDITQTIPDGSIHFKVGDKSYLVRIHSILNGLLEELEKA